MNNIRNTFTLNYKLFNMPNFMGNNLLNICKDLKQCERLIQKLIQLLWCNIFNTHYITWPKVLYVDTPFDLMGSSEIQ